jgi:uncharacterized metal-binding protein
MTKIEMQCVNCTKQNCLIGEMVDVPSFCPSKLAPETLKAAAAQLKNPLYEQMTHAVAKTWKGLADKSRIEMTIDYAKIRGYQRLGLAFCVGMAYEAEMLSNVFMHEGFQVMSVCCMCGGTSSDDVNLPEADKVVPDGRQPMCNPIGQAMLLDQFGSELNIVLGLCVGDDVLFIRQSKAPVTVIAVKDYRLAHNPLGALYQSKSPISRLNTSRPKKAKS